MGIVENTENSYAISYSLLQGTLPTGIVFGRGWYMIAHNGH